MGSIFENQDPLQRLLLSSDQAKMSAQQLPGTQTARRESVRQLTHRAHDAGEWWTATPGDRLSDGQGKAQAMHAGDVVPSAGQAAATQAAIISGEEWRLLPCAFADAAAAHHIQNLEHETPEIRVAAQQQLLILARLCPLQVVPLVFAARTRALQPEIGLPSTLTRSTTVLIATLHDLISAVTASTRLDSGGLRWELTFEERTQRLYKFGCMLGKIMELASDDPREIFEACAAELESAQEALSQFCIRPLPFPVPVVGPGVARAAYLALQDLEWCLHENSRR